ncbi:MAG: Na+:solute symporter [Bacteroidia bacterium]|nr:Na+:solute symporter [Bacteroidia bacterium]
MVLTGFDFFIIILFIIITIALGWYAKSNTNNSIEGFFLGGKNLPWYIAGLSMVATTFAADTPLAVTELVAKNGISGNWIWWNMLLGGMFTAIFYAQLWRRSGVVTDAEFITLRYAGKQANWLKKFKAIYLGVGMNAIILAWVNLALMAILEVFFDLKGIELFGFTALAMLLVAGYSALSGLMGVALTDAFQFFVALIGCIVLAILVVNSDQIGGIAGLKNALPKHSLYILPSVGDSTGSNGLSLGLASFIAIAGMVWWSSWYPGAEPGGGGYIAQRMFSTKNEKHSFMATFFFQFAHYGIRPWPWIIVALCSVVLYPDLGVDDKKLGFVMAMKEFLPSGMRGLLLVAFLGAYMSTVSTHLNWGASYVINDVWNPSKKTSNIIRFSRWVTFGIMILALGVTSQVKSISGVWEFIMECGAGLGLLLMARWFWFRVNAWAEIAATITPFIVYGLLKFVFVHDYPVLGESLSSNPTSFFITVGVTTCCWIIVSLLTKPDPQAHIQNFKNKIYPQGFEQFKKTIPHLFLAWLGGILTVYSFLFMVGKIIFQEWAESGLLLISLIFGVFLFYISAVNGGLLHSKES